MSTSTSKPRLYYMLESPPCRTVMAIARLIGVELELKRVDLSKKEQLNEEFVKVSFFVSIFDNLSIVQYLHYSTFLLFLRIIIHNNSHTRLLLSPFHR